MEKYSFNAKTAYEAPCFKVEFEYEFIEAEAFDEGLCYLRDDSKFKFKNIKITNQNPYIEYRVCDWWPCTNVLKISAYKKGTDIKLPENSNYNDKYWYEGDEYFSTISVYMHEKNKIKCEQWFGSFGNTKTIENGGTFVTMKKHDASDLSQESIRQLKYNTIYPNGKSLLGDNEYSLVIKTDYDVPYCLITFKYDIDKKTYSDIAIKNYTPHIDCRATVIANNHMLIAQYITGTDSLFMPFYKGNEYNATIDLHIPEKNVITCSQAFQPYEYWNKLNICNNSDPSIINTYTLTKRENVQLISQENEVEDESEYVEPDPDDEAGLMDYRDNEIIVKKIKNGTVKVILEFSYRDSNQADLDYDLTVPDDFEERWCEMFDPMEVARETITSHTILNASWSSNKLTIVLDNSTGLIKKKALINDLMYNSLEDANYEACPGESFWVVSCGDIMDM